MKKQLLYFLLTLVVLGAASCKQDARKAEAEKIVAEWIGKTITFPPNIPCTYMGRDTLCPEKNTPYTILVYTDSTGCTSCKLQLYKWNSLIKEADSLFVGKVSFQFYFHPKDEKELQFLLRRDDFKHTVHLDRENEMNAANQFPSVINYQCVLLDNNNKVILIGNPINNPKIWDLYKQAINGEVVESKIEKEVATVAVEQTEIELKGLKVHQTAIGVFTLTNTGNTLLGIKDITASCGCTVPEWDRRPIKPGAKTDIKVKVTPDAVGYFRKTITVYCNTKEGFIQLAVKSRVED